MTKILKKHLEIVKKNKQGKEKVLLKDLIYCKH